MSNPSPHAPKGAALIIAPPSAFAAPQSVGKVGVLGVGAKAPAATRSRLNNSSSSVDSRQDSRTGSSYDHSSGSSQGSGFQGRGESSKGVHEMGLFAGVIEDTAEGGGAGAPPAAGTGAFEPLGPLFTTCALLGESGWAPADWRMLSRGWGACVQGRAHTGSDLDICARRSAGEAALLEATSTALGCAWSIQPSKTIGAHYRCVMLPQIHCAMSSAGLFSSCCLDLELPT
eukprot:1158392-Pelagomonas_calceolata.AAC.22